MVSRFPWARLPIMTPLVVTSTTDPGPVTSAWLLLAVPLTPMVTPPVAFLIDAPLLTTRRFPALTVPTDSPVALLQVEPGPVTVVTLLLAGRLPPIWAKRSARTAPFEITRRFEEPERPTKRFEAVDQLVPGSVAVTVFAFAPA